MNTTNINGNNNNEQSHNNNNRQKQQQQKRVLSIQSHVVHGYVGNKAAVFPLQLLGYDVDIINSVHFSCHTGYEYFPHGTIMDGNQLKTILQGLEMNGLLGNVGNNNNNDDIDDDIDDDNNTIGSILTGYIGNVSFLKAVIDVVTTIKKYNNNCNNSNNKVKYLCDPVLGDDNKFYVPIELVDIYKTIVIPVADIVTPNQFETEKLTGIKVTTIKDARLACQILHNMGPSIVFITSCILIEDDNDDDDDENNKNNKAEEVGDVITIIASSKQDDDDHQQQQMWRIDCPKIPGNFTGTGDVTASLLLGHLQLHPNNINIPLVMEKVINTMYVLIQRTHAAKGKSVQSKELKLIQSKDIIECPPTTYKAKAIFLNK